MTRTAGVVLVFAIIVVQALVMGRAVLALDIALLVALALWLGGKWRVTSIMPYALGIVALAIHFAEEYATGFYREFPRVIGTAPWDESRFAAFNLAWLAVFVIAAVAARRGTSVAMILVLFFAIGAGIINGVGHVALALLRGGYFPGLYTSPLMLASGIAVMRSLRRA